jgi:hypothetical protein
MGKRRDRFIRRQVDQALSKSTNGPRKVAERARRERRIHAAIQAGTFPYTKVIRNWVAVQLGKGASDVTEADCRGLVKKK